MVKRALISLLLVAILVAVVVLPAMAADPITKTASVAINEIINFTITDRGDEGINFGSPTSGMNNWPERAQLGGEAAITLIVNSDTNVNCSIQTRGSGPFSNGNGGSIPLANAKWNTSDTHSGATGMTTSYAPIGESTPGSTRGIDVWYWLDIPTGQQAGVYTTTFYYQAVKR